MISIFTSYQPTGVGKRLGRIQSYSHEIMMIGGCRTAEFSFASSMIEAEEWLRYGIGRHIQSFSERGTMVWEGIVNQVSFTIGSRTIVIGPLLDISNRIKVGWTYPNYGIDWDELAGTYEETDWGDGENETSQATYGVLEEFVSGGQGERDPMVALRDRLVIKLAEPKISETLGEGGESVVITVSCIGYSQLFEKQVYNKPWEAGLDQIDLSVKIESILDVNKFFVGNRSITRQLQDVGIPVYVEAEDNNTAWAIITDHISKDSAEDEVICGMFPGMVFLLDRGDNRKSYSRVAGSDKIIDISGSDINIPQSEITPGGYMQLTDFVGRVQYRITSVSYSMESDLASINYAERSLRSLLASTMLGSF